MFYVKFVGNNLKSSHRRHICNCTLHIELVDVLLIYLYNSFHVIGSLVIAIKLKCEFTVCSAIACT